MCACQRTIAEEYSRTVNTNKTMKEDKITLELHVVSKGEIINNNKKNKRVRVREKEREIEEIMPD